AGYTRDHLPGIDLPPMALGHVALRDALVSRRSRTAEAAGSLSLTALGSLVGAAYRSAEGRRPVPSGGALYPLQLYVVPLPVAAPHVDGVGAGIHPYRPSRHRLESLAAVDRADVARTLVEPELVDSAAALIVLTAMFWRSRFKYGLRGYRFALIEAGHVMQNLVLAAAALGIAARPLGGYYDRLLDGLVGADSLAEASVYPLLLGGGE